MMFGRRPAGWQESNSGTLRPHGGHGVGFHESVIDEIRHGGDAGAGKFRQIAVVVIAAPGFVRPGRRNSRPVPRGRPAHPPPPADGGCGTDRATTARTSRGSGPTRRRSTDQRRCGKIVNRNAAVSRSITIRSTKFAVICTMSCLSRDSSTSTTTRVSDSAPDSAGRRSSAIQKKFRIPHDSRKPARAKSVSVWSMMASAARCGAATASRRQMPTAATPAEATADGWTWIWRGRHRRYATTPALSWALAGADQETDAAAGNRDMS